MKASQKRIIGNFMMSFLSPLVGGTTTAFIIPESWGVNWTILITAFVSSTILTGIVIAQQLQNAKNPRPSS